MKIFEKPSTILIIAFLFIIVGIGEILYNVIFNINLDSLFIDGVFYILIGYGMWILKKWAGILGILSMIETVMINVYIDIYNGEFLSGVLLNQTFFVLAIILIIRNWNYLNPKSLKEYLNPVKKWLPDLIILVFGILYILYPWI